MKTSSNYTSSFITTAIVICSALVIFLTVGTVGNVIPSIDTKSVSSFFIGEESPSPVQFTKVHKKAASTSAQGAEAQGSDE